MKDKQTSLGFFDASVLVGTCREEAKKKIYRIVCENHFVGFGAEIEAEISNKLKGMPGVLAVLPDCLINNSRQVQSIARFSPTNRNYHLNDVFSYYHLSERNLETISDNCCVVIRKPNGKFGTEEQTVDFCTQMLTKVLGSEDDAKKRIYIVWGNAPFGFCAEISVEMLTKLNVLVISLSFPLRPDRGHFYETWDEHYADPENSGERIW